MNKNGLRYLSMGFLFSALLLGGFQMIDQSNAYEELAHEEETHAEENNSLAEVDSTVEEAPEEDSASEEAKIDSTQENDATEEDSSEESTEVEEPVETVTITVGDGQPSSVATTQLENHGVIEDAFEFDQYLEDNDYARKIRPGNYEVTTNMDFEQIVNVLLNR